MAPGERDRVRGMSIELEGAAQMIELGTFEWSGVHAAPARARAHQGREDGEIRARVVMRMLWVMTIFEFAVGLAFLLVPVWIRRHLMPGHERYESAFARSAMSPWNIRFIGVVFLLMGAVTGFTYLNSR